MSVVARFALQEALRRRVFVVVAVLTAAFLALYALAVWQAFDSNFDRDAVVGATLLGLGMFGTLFLGVVLAIFLTLGAIRGDAERGLLQPLLVRPVSRRDVLLARMLAAGGVSALYTLVVYALAVIITGTVGDWWVSAPVLPGLSLVLGVVIVTALSLAGSVVLASTANGIAVFMAFGAGLVAGLLGQIGDALGSDTLSSIAGIVSYALPFEALYQFGLHELSEATSGFDRFVVQLGPLGGAQDAGAGLWLWAVAYLAAVVAVAVYAFRRADL